MARAAAVVSGDGAEIQSLLDSLFFGEIPDFELAALVATDSGPSLRRGEAQHIPGYTVDASIFPNAATFTRALTAKLLDLDVDTAVLAAVEPEPDESFYRAFTGRCVCLRLAAEEGRLTASALLADADGSAARRLGRAGIELLPGEDGRSARRRLGEAGSGDLLAEAVKSCMRDFH